MRRKMPLWLWSVLVPAALLAGGCGTTVTMEFPHSLVDADGDPILLDDVEAILEDSDLSDEEKRQALRDLGIEDEKLIDALLL